MRVIYNLLTYIATAHIWVAQFFSKKLGLFVKGRKSSFKILSEKISSTDTSIWFHCASLGEYEQGYPIMEAAKKQYPNHKIVVSFFSPSGYEIKKDTPIADVVVYLPMDTRANARKFIAMTNPSVALFVKYEFWPNYLLELQEKNIPSILVSGLFRKKQIFFKSYGGFMRSALRSLSHIFVQDAHSEMLVKQLKIDQVSISGDTRFDRVSHQIEQDNRLEFMDTFTEKAICVVCGSTWREDEAVLLDYINSSPKHVKFVIAPHKIEPKNIAEYVSKITKKVVQYSELKTSNSRTKEIAFSLQDYQVLIVDTIGLLTKIYSYADVAYVGGAMGTTGLHNILEPATFGVPIVIGKNYDDFPEAERLRSLAGLYSIDSQKSCTEILTKLVEDDQFREKTGMISEHFVNSNTGATAKIMAFLSKTIS